MVDRGFDDLVPLVLLVRFLSDRRVQLRHDLGAHPARTDEWGEQRLDAPRVVLLQALRQLELLFTLCSLVVPLRG